MELQVLGILTSNDFKNNVTTFAGHKKTSVFGGGFKKNI
jgi:hypothetical protein